MCLQAVNDEQGFHWEDGKQGRRVETATVVSSVATVRMYLIKHSCYIHQALLYRWVNKCDTF